MGMNNDLHTDVVVVGGGVAGLTAAQLLRRAGHHVTLIDAADPGGRARVDRRGDVLFNRGPRALYLGGDAHRLLRALDVPLSGGPPSTEAFARRGDLVGELPAGAVSLARTPLLRARGKAAIARFMAAFGRVRADELGDETFGAWLDGRGLPDDAHEVVEMLSRVATYANAPDVASADMVVAQMQRAFRDGVRYLDGGWQTIVDALARGLVLERGAVESVVDDGGSVRVVRADGVDVCARACVLAVGTPDTAARLLARPAFSVGPPVEAACLELATSVAPKRALLFGLDRPLYLSTHSNAARLAPDGVHVVHVARYLAPDEQHDPAAARAELEAHAVCAGLTSATTLDARYLHRMTVAGGLAIARTGGLRGRPSVDDAAVPGVFLAGDWVGPTGHLLDAAMASAEVAAGRAARAVGRATLTAR